MSRFKLKNIVLAGMALTIMTGCHWDMWNSDRYEPLEKGEFFGENESSSRMLVAGVVPYQGARLDTHYYEGKNAEGEFIANLPTQITLSKELLLRGQNRFEVFCTPCHGPQGLGNGMITKRGFPAPPSYTDPRLLESPLGYFYDVMTNGFGRMYSYKTRISVEDRWAIAAYIRALQLSQNATPDLLTQELVDIASDPEKTEAFNTEALGADDAHGGGHGEGGHGEDASHDDHGASDDDHGHGNESEEGH